MIGKCNDEYSFPHKLLLTKKNIWRFRKACANGTSANIKLPKTHLHKRRPSGRFLGRPLGLLLKTGLSLMKNVLKSPTKRVLIPLVLTAAESAKDSAIQKKIFWLGMTTLIV